MRFVLYVIEMVVFIILFWSFNNEQGNNRDREMDANGYLFWWTWLFGIILLGVLAGFGLNNSIAGVR